MSLEDNGTATETAGAEAEETIEATGAESQESELGDKDQETGKVYTQAEVDALNAKTRKATERKVRRDIERELSQRNPVQEKPIELTQPKREDFKSDTEYDDARLDFKLEVREAKKQAEISKAKAEQADRQFRDEALNFLDECEDLPGFDRDMFVSTFGQGFSDDFVSVLMESPKRSQIAEYLCTYEDEAEKLSDMSEARQKAYIGIIEARLEKKHKAAADPSPNLKGGKAAIDRLKTDPDSLSDAEYARLNTQKRLEERRSR